MTRLVLADVMDGIASTLEGALTGCRVYAWPTESPAAPCAIVGYPTTTEFDATFDDGSDRVEFPIWLLVGKVADRTARDRLSALISGDASTIKGALDGDLGGAVQTSRVTDLSIEAVPVGGVDYLAARFTIEVYT